VVDEAAAAVVVAGDAEVAVAGAEHEAGAVVAAGVDQQIAVRRTVVPAQGPARVRVRVPVRVPVQDLTPVREVLDREHVREPDLVGIAPEPDRVEHVRVLALVRGIVPVRGLRATDLEHGHRGTVRVIVLVIALGVRETGQVMVIGQAMDTVPVAATITIIGITVVGMGIGGTVGHIIR
jgi:hypothetical protein